MTCLVNKFCRSLRHLCLHLGVFLIFLAFNNCTGSGFETTHSLSSLAQEGSNNESSPFISSFTASQTRIILGQSTTLRWSVSGASSLHLDPGGLDVSGLNSMVVSPTVNTTYTLTASNNSRRMASPPLDIVVTLNGGGGDLEQITMTPTTADFPNPDRGFYGWSGSDFVTSFDLGSIQSEYNQGRRLVQAAMQLGSYRTTDLPNSYLTALNDRFTSLRAAGMKAVLVFRYDNNLPANDATATQIARHLQQLKPVLTANADVIPFMRAGFIGAFGEWHSSMNGNTCGFNSPPNITCEMANAARATVRDALLANVPSTTQIGFRYPADLMLWYPTANQQKRAGMSNDCFLAGPSDSGTFQNNNQRLYAQSLSDGTAFGGETCDNAEFPLRISCSDILTEGPQYHLAWLNVNYAVTFINSWKNGKCFDQVSRSMGYRLQIDAVRAPSTATPNSQVTVDVDMRNIGWSRVFQDRKIVVTLRNKATGTLYTGAALSPLYALNPQAMASTRITVNITLSGAPVGDYDILVSAPDAFASLANDARFATRFANADDSAKNQAWENNSARFRTGLTLKVQ